MIVGKLVPRSALASRGLLPMDSLHSLNDVPCPLRWRKDASQPAFQLGGLACTHYQVRQVTFGIDQRRSDAFQEIQLINGGMQ